MGPSPLPPTLVTEPLFIDTPAELARFAATLQGAPAIAIDTEFIREKSYVPSLEIVQVAGPTGPVAVIDYAALGERADDPLMAIVKDPAVLKVMHAADQDLEMLQLLTGTVVGPIWDTQLVAGLMGYTGRTGYGAIVESLLGAKVAKGEAMTDWAQRPLTGDQLHYAAEDVRYLLPLQALEVQKLEAQGRLAWATEECERLRRNVAENLATRADTETLHMRVRGWTGLDRKGLAILRELARWREAEARRRNRPRGSILKDEILVELARRAPSAPHKLKTLRGLNPRDLERHAEAIVGVIEQAKRLPSDQWPVPGTPGPQLDEGESALVALLSAVLQTECARQDLLPSLVATTGDLQRLVEAYGKGRQAESPVLSGWRGTVVGPALSGILEGRSAVRWDAKGRRLAVTPAG